MKISVLTWERKLLEYIENNKLIYIECTLFKKVGGKKKKVGESVIPPRKISVRNDFRRVCGRDCLDCKLQLF